MPYRFSLPRWALVVVVLGGWQGVGSEPQSAQAAVPTNPIVLRSCDRILQGRFDEAFDILANAPDDQLADEQARQLKKWLADYHELSIQREALRTKDFNRYVSRAKTLIEELTDPQYPRWMVEVLRTHGAVFVPDHRDDDDDTSSEEATKRLRDEFTTTVDAVLNNIEETDRRERYRRWALADFDRFDDGRFTSIAGLASSRSAPGLAGALVSMVQRAASAENVHRVHASGKAPRRGLFDRLEKLASWNDDDADLQPLFDAAMLVGLIGNLRMTLAEDTLAEIVFPTTIRPTLGRTVFNLYRRERAISATQAALVNAADPDGFRNEDWVRTLTSDAESEAIKLTGTGKWERAMRIYAGLEELHPRENSYRDGRIASVSRVRIKRFYTPTSRWEDDLDKIDTQMIDDGLQKIARRYVVDPDFKEIVLSGFRAVLLLIEEDKLHHVFPALEDELEKLSFSARVNKRIKDIRRSDALDINGAMVQFKRLMKINAETIDLPSRVIINEFMLGALEPLDRFTSVIWPAEVAEFRKRTLGEFFGVGIQITIKKGWLTVVQPLDDTPAYRAGIAPGEIIAKIEGVTTKNMAIGDAVRKITGDEGTKVTLTIRSGENDDERDVTLTRENIKIRSVKGEHRDDTGDWDFFLDDEKKIAYIRVTAFMERTVDDLRDNIQRLVDQGVQGLILDLRFNPGGLLRSAVDMCDLFLPTGAKIVSTKGKHSRPMSEEADSDNAFPELSLIALVNEYSASASEIVAGALQDNDNRALILGERTFGKGSVQNLYPIGDYRAYLKLTTAHYYLPSGRLVHKTDDAETWGVDPDVPVKLVPREINKIMRLGRKADLLRGKKENDDAAARHENGENGQNATADDPKATKKADATKKEDNVPHDEIDDLPDVDPQLEAALLVMRAHLISKKPWPATARADTNEVKTQ